MEAAMNTAAEIAHALGGADHSKRIKRSERGWIAKCCCHDDKTPSLSLEDGEDGKLLVRCFAGCDARDILAALRCRGLLDDRRRDFKPIRTAPPKPADPAKNRHSGFVEQIWREAVDPRGTLGEKYLDGRGIELDDDLALRVLRFHARCPFGRDEAGKTVHAPALVVAFRPVRDDDETKPPPAIHRIGLKPDGTKLGKMMLGSVAGCAVKLDADENVTEGLGVAEGLETAMAVRGTGWRPIWALGSAGAIRTFAPIAGIEALTIFADNDETGLAAARECAQRWADAGCEAFIHLRTADGKDFADA
jgi:hypothetical protein